MKKRVYILVLAAALLSSCVRIPELHLHRDGHLLIQLPVVELDLDVYWNYSTDYGWEYDFTYDWRKQWFYGWDEEDEKQFGEIGYSKKPTAFNIRRYYLGYDPDARHWERDPDQVHDTVYLAEYKLGYYDILAWNIVNTIDGVQALDYWEGQAPYDSVVAYTNTTRFSVSRAPAVNTATVRYQPEALFAGTKDTLFISQDPRDYIYDPIKNVYRKTVHMTLYPVTYIYLVQLILHHNHSDEHVGTNGGGISDVQGDAVLTGMSANTVLNTGIAGQSETSVYYSTRMKEHMKGRNDEDVDIIGGRLYTFGICNVNPNLVTKRNQVADLIQTNDRPYSAADLAAQDTKEHYVGIQVKFRNSLDSTLYFNVTDSVRKYYRGGVLTLELDMDTVKVPHKSTGLFDATVVEPDSTTYIFDL